MRRTYDNNFLKYVLCHNISGDREMPKKKLTVYVPMVLYDKLMAKVFERMQERKQFRGIISEIAVEALRAYLD